MKNKIVNDIIEFVNNNLGYPVKLDESSKLSTDAGLDSMDALNILNYIDRTYNVYIDESEIDILKGSIEDIADFICDKLKNGA